MKAVEGATRTGERYSHRHASGTAGAATSAPNGVVVLSTAPANTSAAAAGGVGIGVGAAHTHTHARTSTHVALCPNCGQHYNSTGSCQSTRQARQCQSPRSPALDDVDAELSYEPPQAQPHPALAASGARYPNASPACDRVHHGVPPSADNARTLHHYQCQCTSPFTSGSASAAFAAAAAAPLSYSHAHAHAKCPLCNAAIAAPLPAAPSAPAPGSPTAPPAPAAAAFLFSASPQGQPTAILLNATPTFIPPLMLFSAPSGPNALPLAMPVQVPVPGYALWPSPLNAAQPNVNVQVCGAANGEQHVTLPQCAHLIGAAAAAATPYAVPPCCAEHASMSLAIGVGAGVRHTRHTHEHEHEHQHSSCSAHHCNPKLSRDHLLDTTDELNNAAALRQQPHCPTNQRSYAPRQHRQHRRHQNTDRDGTLDSPLTTESDRCSGDQLEAHNSGASNRTQPYAYAYALAAAESSGADAFQLQLHSPQDSYVRPIAHAAHAISPFHRGSAQRATIDSSSSSARTRRSPQSGHAAAGGQQPLSASGAAANASNASHAAVQVPAQVQVQVPVSAQMRSAVTVPTSRSARNGNQIPTAAVVGSPRAVFTQASNL